MTVQKRPHLLYVAWGFPPSRSAGVYRALATANAFARSGWDVTVLTASREVFEYQTDVDTELESLIDPAIHVVRVPFSWIRGEPDVSRWSRLRIASNLLWTYLRAKWDLVNFPEPVYGAWARHLIESTNRVHRQKPVDLVIGTANPNVDFVPGWHLHRKAGVPYVMDYRDTWHLDVYRDKRIGSLRARSASKERQLLRRAAEAWFVNRPIRDWHAREYPEASENYHVVANAFDDEFAEKFAGLQPSVVGPSKRGLVFGYLGTVYGPMPLKETLEGWRKARQESQLVAASRLVFKGRLGHFAEPDPRVLALLQEYRADAVYYEGPVSKTEVATAYKQFDALLLILGHSKYVTSGKVFEYAATGLPIASLHHPETAATDVLRGRGDWFPMNEVSVNEACRVLLTTAERAATMTSEDYAKNQQWAGHLSRERQLKLRIEHLSALANRVDA
ncbi:glycosyl transferase [Arthrobacter sp. JZ12]|uniref:glycosyltransferase n=1 Tax=Arthrobacter sp. JZ12 TaxID=2654190 RepID=UPI002B4A7E1C|nr:glycosyltransferase [Arthrobacter sp. JZ12]WRH25380.1 glycosyl transferase [Arthrobacter sp. JZ12]